MAFTAPQPEHDLLEANHRSATTTAPPRQAVLYWICRRNSANEASATWRARRRLRIIPATFRSSITSVPNRPVRLVVALCSASRRWSATRPCAFPSADDARRHRFDDCCRVRRSGPRRRDKVRDRRRTFRSDLPRCRGLGISSPVDRTARVLIPKSTPTTAPGAAAGGRDTSCSTVNAANQRPRPNRTDTPSTRPVPAVTRSASRVPGSCSFTRPIRGSTACRASQRNAPVVNRIDGRAFRLDLNRGNPAGLAFPL